MFVFKSLFKIRIDPEKPQTPEIIVIVLAPKLFFIKKGEKFSSENIWVKRPGKGDFSADDYETVLGCTAACDININVQLQEADVLNYPDDGE